MVLVGITWMWVCGTSYPAMMTLTRSGANAACWAAPTIRVTSNKCAIKFGRSIHPVVEFFDRNNQRVPMRHGVDRHERHAAFVAPYECSREFALDDAGEDRWHTNDRNPNGRRNHGRVGMRRLRAMAHDQHTGHPEPAVETERMVDGIWTIPNLFTLLRLLCLPVFIWLLFGLESRQAAAWMLGLLGATDWVDGYLARRLGQTSEFGKKFDPTVDRLLFFVAIVAILIDQSMPLWFGIAVLVREVAVGVTIAIATLVFHMRPFDVTFLGKLATFLLMFAVPGFLMGNSTIPGAAAFTVAAWCFGIPGLILSYYTAIAYIPDIRAGIAAGRARAAV